MCAAIGVIMNDDDEDTDATPKLYDLLCIYSNHSLTG